MSTKYEVIASKYETTYITKGIEIDDLVRTTRLARSATSGSGFLNQFQTYMAIYEGSTVAGILSVFFGDFLSAFKEIAQEDYNFASDIYFNFGAYGYDNAKVRLKYEQVEVTDIDSGAYVATFWRTAGSHEMLALHHPSGGWSIL